MKPATTRLRFVSAKDPQKITDFLRAIGIRVQIYGAPVWDGTRWYLWFVPPDIMSRDVPNTKL